MSNEKTQIEVKSIEDKKVLGSSRLTSFWCNDEKRTVVVTILFWNDGSVTWAKE